MATLLELAKIKLHAVRSDGAKFLDGERDDALDTSWLSVSNGQVTLGPGVYDELLVVKGEVSDDQIKAWAAMDSPFYDAAGNIVYEGAGGRIEMDKFGQRFYRIADIDPENPNEVPEPAIEFNVETGGAYFTGNIISANPLTGDYSELTDGRLSFYKNSLEGMRRSYYVKRIQTGIATNGQTVVLMDFETTPTVIVTPIKYFAGSETQQMEVGIENLTKDRFTMINRLIVPGNSASLSKSSSSGSVSGDYYECVSNLSPFECIRIDIKLEPWLYAEFKQAGAIQRDIEARFYYQAEGDSNWVHAGSRSASLLVHRDTGGLITVWRPYFDSQYINFSMSLAKGKYRAKVEIRETYWSSGGNPRNVDSSLGSPSFYAVDFTFIDGGDASYVAIEGG